VFFALTLETLRAPGYVERQIELHEESVGLDPTLWLSWFNWGVALYLNLGKYEEALEKLLLAEALRADHHTAFVHLAGIYERLGNTLAKTSALLEIRREGLALLEKAAAPVAVRTGPHGRPTGSSSAGACERPGRTRRRRRTMRRRRRRTGVRHSRQVSASSVGSNHG